MKRIAASKSHPISFGPRRLCPDCRQQVSTERGRFVSHGPGPVNQFTCPGSGKLVKSANRVAPVIAHDDGKL